MPYKSNKQRRFMHAAEARGEISPKVVNEFDRASRGMKLPEKAKAGAKAKVEAEAGAGAAWIKPMSKPKPRQTSKIRK